MPSVAQAVALVRVYDYLMQPTGAAGGNAKPVQGVIVTLTPIANAQSINPVTQVPAAPIQSTVTDGNGYWEAWVVPTDNLNPSGMLYQVDDTFRSYRVNPIAAGIPGPGWQSSAILVSQPPGLGVAGFTLPGGTTVQGDLTLGSATSEGHLIMQDGVYPPVANGGGDLVAYTTGSTAIAASSTGLRKSAWQFFSTNVNDLDSAVIDMQVVQTGGAGTIIRTGIDIRIFTQPDNGGDTSGLLISQTGGGNGATIYHNTFVKPVGYADYSAAVGVALETGTSDQSSAILAIAGLKYATQLVDNASTGIHVRLDAPNAKGINVWPGQGVADGREAISVGQYNLGAPTNPLYFGVKINGITTISALAGLVGTIFSVQVTGSVNLLSVATTGLQLGAASVPVGIGTAALAQAGVILQETLTAVGGFAHELLVQGTLTAAANNDGLRAISVGGASLVFAKGAFVGLTAAGLFINGSGWAVSGAGTIANAYAINVTAPTIGTNNFAINTSGGPSAFADSATASGGSSVSMTATALTSGFLLSLVHNTSAFTGTALRILAANGSGTFTGNFLDFQVNAVSVFKVDSFGHIIASSAATPTTSNLGANVTSVTPTGNDSVGKLVVVMAGALAANTRIATVTYANAFAATPKLVMLVNQTSGAGLAIVNFYAAAKAAGSFDLTADQALAAGTYEAEYLVIG